MLGNNDFTYLEGFAGSGTQKQGVFPSPTVVSISPSTGDSGGGTPVTITGAAFLAGPAVTIGGQNATSIVRVSLDTITCVTPAHAAGATNVVVTNTDTHSGTLVNGFTFTQAFVPTDIAGIAGWYRVSSLMGINGSAIATWSDESGASNDATQAVAIHKPTLSFSAGPSGGHAVSFDATSNDQYLLANGLAPTFSGSAPTFTFFIVNAFNNFTPPTANYWILSTRKTASNMHQFFGNNDDPGIAYAFTDDPGTHGSSVVDDTNTQDNQFEIFTVTSNTAATLYRGGVLSGTAAGGLPGTRTYTPDTVAFGANVLVTSTDGANAHLCEVIVYDSALSSSNLNLVGNYLATKYGLSWTNI